MLTALFIGALVIYGASEYLRQRRETSAEQGYARAQSATDFQKVASDFAGTVPGGNAELMLADRLRAEGKLEESSRILHTFLEKYPEHPLISGAWTSLAGNLELLGKMDEALTTYQKVSTAYANSFSAPLSLMAQARILAQQGKIEEARRLYEQVMTQYQNNIVAQRAAQELRLLKK